VDSEWAPKEELHLDNATAVIWQRPKGEVKGILLWVPGCGGRATDMFTRFGPDGHKLESCQNPCTDKVSNSENCCPLQQETVLARMKARHLGYLVVSVQTGKGHNDRCPYERDLKLIRKSLEYVKSQENVMDKPVIVAGHSGGGGWAPTISTYVNGSCTIMGAATARKGNHLWTEEGKKSELGFPEDYRAPVFFIHQKEAEVKDGTLSHNINENMKALSDRGIRSAQVLGDFMEQKDDRGKQRHYNYVGAYMGEAIDFCETGKVPPLTISKPLELKEWQQEMGYAPFPTTVR